MNTFYKRLKKRELALEKWLNENNAKEYLDETTLLLSTMPKSTIAEEFLEGLKKGIIHCEENEEIKALDYSWYLGERNSGEALAYGLDMYKTKGKLSKSDLGPEGLPGIEIKSQVGAIIDEYFASLPVHYAINKWKESQSSIIDIAIESDTIPSEAKECLLELVAIWNYKIAIECGEELLSSVSINSIRKRSPFWVTLTTHERDSIPILVIK